MCGLRPLAHGCGPIRCRLESSYGTPMPGFHVRYAIDDNTNLRFAVTRTMARPNYYDAVPYRSQNDNDFTVASGNPDLSPTRSWNVDVLAERYLKSVGVISAGVFYKRLDDYIYIFTLQQQINSTQYQVTQPLNGDAGDRQGRRARAAEPAALPAVAIERHRRLCELHFQ